MSDTVRRVGVLIVLAVVLAAAAVSQGEPAGVAVSVSAPPPIDGPTVAPDAAISAAWYCAEGTATADGRAAETVIVGNLEPHPIDVATTVMAGSGLAPVTERVRLPPYAQRRIDIGDLLRAPEPGVVVEVFGGRAVVEHEVEGRDDVAVGPCSRAAARRWFFAEGTTERGAEDWLALFNPFGTDAIVDVTLITQEGLLSPAPVQALVVPRRSRVSVAVHELALRQPGVAVAVRARAGRIVAERTALFDGSDARRGIAVSLGATGAARRWRFPVGESGEGIAQSISVANFADRTAQVEVVLRLDDDRAVTPESVNVPGNGVVRVDVAGKLATATSYSVEVRSRNGIPVVAGAFGVWAAPAPVTAVAATTGSVSVAHRWAFAIGRLNTSGDTLISALNVGTEPITVELFAYTLDDPNSPASAPALAVPPGERGVFSLGERGVEPDQVIVVAADGPIVVGREIVGAAGGTGPGAGRSFSPGVPIDEAQP